MNLSRNLNLEKKKIKEDTFLSNFLRKYETLIYYKNLKMKKYKFLLSFN